MPVVAFAILTVLPAGIHPMAVSLLGILTGLGILIWLLTGYEWIRSRSTLGGVVIQLSPLLTTNCIGNGRFVVDSARARDSA